MFEGIRCKPFRMLLWRNVETLLLKSSIVSLMGGSLSRSKSSLSSNIEQKVSKQDDTNMSAGMTSSAGLFRFRFLVKASMTQNNHMTIQKRSTLGTRLKVRPVHQSAMTVKSIQKNLEVYDSDSDEARVSSTPINSDTNVKSKIVKSWRDDCGIREAPCAKGCSRTATDTSCCFSFITRTRPTTYATGSGSGSYEGHRW